jgi:hypothetical protein
MIAGGAVAIVIGSLGLGLHWGRTTPEPNASASGVSHSSVGSSSRTTSEDPAEFLALFVQALRSGDAGFLFDRVDPAVIARYGDPACRATIPSLFDASASLTLRSTTGPATFAYEGDGKSVAVPDVYTFTVDGTLGGLPATRDYHLALVDGSFHLFLDCGTPLPGAP